MPCLMFYETFCFYFFYLLFRSSSSFFFFYGLMFPSLSQFLLLFMFAFNYYNFPLKLQLQFFYVSFNYFEYKSGTSFITRTLYLIVVTFKVCFYTIFQIWIFYFIYRNVHKKTLT